MAYTFDPNKAPDLVSGESPVYERTGATVPPVIGVTTSDNVITGFLNKAQKMPEGMGVGGTFNFYSSDGGNVTATVCHDVFAPMPGASGDAEVTTIARLRSDEFTYEIMMGEVTEAGTEIEHLEITVNEDIDADMLIALASFRMEATGSVYQQWITFGRVQAGSVPPGSPVTYRSTPMNLPVGGNAQGTLSIQFV